jgi:ATP-dependent RNA circularization protein (DNA/RNA ligase family)
MPKAYIRKNQREIEELYYFLFEYPELREYLPEEQRHKVEERRLQHLDRFWRQMGHKLRDDDPPPHRMEPVEEIEYPPKATPEGRRMILHLYEMWRSSESEHARNPGQKAKALLMEKFEFKTVEALDKFLQRARRKARSYNKKTVVLDAPDDGCPF